MFAYRPVKKLRLNFFLVIICEDYYGSGYYRLEKSSKSKLFHERTFE